MITRLVDAKRIVVKTGSTLITDSNGEARTGWLQRFAADLKAMKARGQEVLWVSSGAVGLGRRLLANAQNLNEKQAAAALGQPLLMAAISKALSSEGLLAAQALLTLEDTEQRRRWLNARATLETLLSAGAIPIINENDTVATDEIRYGDNDRLAARVAQMVSADLLVLLSDVDGLYTADPRKVSTAEHIPLLKELTAETLQLASGPNSQAKLGSGGMVTKLAAADIAYRAGCSTVITLGERDRPIGALDRGDRASWIVPSESPLSARQTWLRGHLTPEGSIMVDDGAAKALKAGASLLPVGVVSVAGRFDKGAAVAVLAAGGESLGKGVSAYSSADIDRIKGLQSEDTVAILGYRGRPAVIHRDDLVLNG